MESKEPKESKGNNVLVDKELSDMFTTGSIKNTILKYCDNTSIFNLFKSNKKISVRISELLIPDNIDIVELLSNPFFQVLRYIDEKDKDKACLNLIKKLSMCAISDISQIFAFALRKSLIEARTHYRENLELEEKFECLAHLNSTGYFELYQMFEKTKSLYDYMSSLEPKKILKLVKSVKFESFMVFELKLFRDWQKDFWEKATPKQKLEFLRCIGCVDDYVAQNISEKCEGQNNFADYISTLKPEEIPEFAKGIKFRNIHAFKTLFKNWQKDFLEKTSTKLKLKCLKYFDCVDADTIYTIFGGKQKFDKQVKFGLKSEQKLESVKGIKFEGLESFKLLFTNFQKEFVENTNDQQKLEYIEYFSIVYMNDFGDMFGGKQGLKNFVSKLKPEEIPELVKNIKWGHFGYFIEIFTNFQKEFVEKTNNQQKWECVKYYKKEYPSKFPCFSEIFGGLYREFVRNLEPEKILELNEIIKFNSFYSFEAIFGKKCTEYILSKLTTLQKWELAGCFEYVKVDYCKGYEDYGEIDDDIYKMFGGKKEFENNVVSKLKIGQKISFFVKSTRGGQNIKVFRMLFKSVEEFYKEIKENQRYLVLKSLNYVDMNEIVQKISEIEKEEEKLKISPNISANSQNNKNEFTISTENKEIGDL